MPRRKKTTTIAFIKDVVNRRNRQSTCDPKVREGWNSLLEEILHANNAYEGFNYLTADKVPDGCEPGIIPSYDDGKHEFPDETRRFYY
jgi:hypothetical protein